MYKLLPFLLVLAVLSSCTREGCTDQDAANYDQNANSDDGSCVYDKNALRINLHHLIGSEEIQLKDKQYTNIAGNKYSLHRLQYYLSGLEVLNSEGEWLRISDFQYIDIEDESTWQIENPDLPDLVLDSLRFVFGLYPEINETNALPAELNNINMAWPDPMGGGYHFMKMEGKFNDTSGSDINFAMHIGRLVNHEGTTDPFIRFSFPLDGFELVDNDKDLWLLMDLNEWFTGDTYYDLGVYRGGIMGNHKAQRHLHANGKTVFTLQTQTP